MESETVEKLIIFLVSIILGIGFFLGLISLIVYILKQSTEEVADEFLEDLSDEEREEFIKSWNRAIDESV